MDHKMALFSLPTELLSNPMTVEFLGVFAKNRTSDFFLKHPKLFFLYLRNQISLKGSFVFKSNGKVSSITSY